MTGNLHGWVTEAANRAPEHRAVIGEDETLSYGSLDEYSNRVAHTLREFGCRRGHRVAVYTPKSARALANFVGVLKAGCVYVPVDAHGGPVRSAQIIRQSDPKVILFSGCEPTEVDDLRLRGAMNGAGTGWLGPTEADVGADFTSEDVDRAPGHFVDAGAGRDDLASILFPAARPRPVRGVPLTHRHIRAFAEWAVDYFDLGPSDRLSGHSDLASGLSILDTWASFAAGAELHHVPRWAHRMPHEIPRLVDERKLTLWVSVPSQLTYVARFRGLEGLALPSLRHVAWSGHTLPTPVLLHWRGRLPTTTFTHLYGPPATALAISHYRIPASFDNPTADIPIGTGLRGDELLVLDDDRVPVAAGRVGDIYVRGESVVTRVRRWADGTTSAHAPSGGSEPPVRTGDRGRREADGTVTLVGTTDFGLLAGTPSLSLAEVENVILQLEEVAACAVILVPATDPGPTPVACAYVPSNGRPLRVAHAAERLRDRLPPHAIPSRWLVLDELPLDRGGRIDRERASALLGG
jgi:acyl-coenzyme A synthetase/AMP-(fatty) acid ligase